MYNFALALFLCLIAFIIGEFVSNKTKAWIPSVFVTAIVFLVGYWTIFPQTLISDTFLIPFGGSIAVFMMITHLGTIISVRQLLSQWKTIVICLAGLLGMCLLGFACTFIIDPTYVYAGLPPLTGGVIAATTMQSAAQAAGNEKAALLAIAMYCLQGFAGYPLTAIMLKKEGKKLLAEYRAGNVKAAESFDMNSTAEKKKALIPPIPEKYNSTALVLAKLAVCAWLALQLGRLTGISGAVWALLIGIGFAQLGILDKNILNKANSYGIVGIAIMLNVYDGLKTATPEMLGSCIGPMAILIIFGVAGMALFAFITNKIFKRSFAMSFASCLTALYGFPPNAIITEESCNALAETPEEKEYLMGQMLPPMLVGGFTSVTITSVIIAGVFASVFFGA